MGQRTAPIENQCSSFGEIHLAELLSAIKQEIAILMGTYKSMFVEIHSTIDSQRVFCCVLEEISTEGRNSNPCQEWEEEEEEHDVVLKCFTTTIDS